MSYPLDTDVNELYHPSKSNSERYKNATKSLYQKLKNKKLLKAFHEQFTKLITEGHMEMLSPEQAEVVFRLSQRFELDRIPQEHLLQV